MVMAYIIFVNPAIKRALAKAGVYFRPGKIIQGSKNIGVGVRAEQGPRGIDRDRGDHGLVEQVPRPEMVHLARDLNDGAPSTFAAMPHRRSTRPFLGLRMHFNQGLTRVTLGPRGQSVRLRVSHDF